MPDYELAKIFESLCGVEVTHHYPTANNNKYYVHCKVHDNQNLRDLLDFAKTANCVVQIYQHENEFRYAVVVPHNDRKLLMQIYENTKEQHAN